MEFLKDLLGEELFKLETDLAEIQAEIDKQYTPANGGEADVH